MSDVWTFGPVKDSAQTYSTGDQVPHRHFTVSLNGKVVGEVECHMHRRKGPDGKPDASFGFTPVIYGPVPGGS